MMQSCIFCKIIAKQIPAAVVAENDAVLVIKDIAPQAPIHYLIIPKIHVCDVSSLEAEHASIASALFAMAKQLGHEIPGAKDFRLLINNGAGAGQSVFHLHMHFLAGKKMADF
jgi:histidine triad (HIT) family protein